MDVHLMNGCDGRTAWRAPEGSVVMGRAYRNSAAVPSCSRDTVWSHFITVCCLVVARDQSPPSNAAHSITAGCKPF